MIAPAATPGPHPHRRHCTFSTGADAAFCNEAGAVIGAAAAGTAKAGAPTAKAAAARSFTGIFMTKSPLFLIQTADKCRGSTPGQPSPLRCVPGSLPALAAGRSHQRVIGRRARAREQATVPVRYRQLEME